MHLINGGAPAPKPSLALELVRHRVLGKVYSKWRAIIAETGESDTAFLIGLKELHGITIDKKSDPMLYVVQDTQQMRLLSESGVENPTTLQVLLTSRVIDLDEDNAHQRFAKYLEKQNEQNAMPA